MWRRATANRGSGSSVPLHRHYFQVLLPGRRQFHGAKKLFLSDHYGVQSAHMIEGKCIVHTFKNYTKLKNVGAEDYFCWFEYNAATRGFTPDRVALSDKEEPDAETVTSMLGFQSYWDATYADELANFREHGHAGEVWFGADVMETVASWTKSLCTDFSQGHLVNHVDDDKSGPVEQNDKDLSSWSVLDIGTGNGLLLQELAKQGFLDLTGTDYSEGAIDLARNLADRGGFTNIKFLVDDVLETKLERKYKLVIDKGTLDAIGLHPDGPIKRIMYWDSVSRLVASDGILVITSCNSTKDELVQEVDNFNQRRVGASQEAAGTIADQEAGRDPPLFRFLDHVRSYPTFMFGGSEGSRVTTVAFLRN